MIRKWGGAFLVGILAMGACTGGVRDVREAMANRAPRAVSCREFVSNAPANVWVRLSGAAGALRDSAYRETNGVVDRLYVPLRCEGSVDGSIRMVLASDDPGLLQAISANPDAEVRREIVGMVRTSRDHRTGTTTGGGLEGGCPKCSVKIQGLAPGYVVIEEGVEPSLLRGLAWLIGAIVGWVATLKIVRS